MVEWVMKMLMACWRPVQKYTHLGEENGDNHDPLLWYKDLGDHAAGEFSIAVIQANAILEDMSQVETGPFGTFVGVYDGHGGPEASRYVNDNLYRHLQKYATQEGGMSAEVLRQAFKQTEEGFLDIVKDSWLTKPQLAAVGSCCLVGVVWESKLYIASLGDSKAVLGRFSRNLQSVVATEISTEHNASVEAVRQELQALHPDDPRIVVLKHGVWRVKGLIQVSRSIGDVYLKKAEFNREPLIGRFRLPEPLTRPVMSAEPEIEVLDITADVEFVIFASDGLWEHMSNQEAVDIVYNHPRTGIARRLIRCALHEAAKKREMRYSDLKKIERGIRRHFHDDITVVVVYLDHDLVSNGSSISHHISVKGGVDKPS